MAQAEEAGCPAKVVVRVFGDRNWTEEGYKTFMIEPSTKISEVRVAPRSCRAMRGWFASQSTKSYAFGSSLARI